MAYRIEYGKNRKYKGIQKQRRWGSVLAALGIITAVACMCFCVVNYVGLDSLLPGDPAVTGAALDTLVENWQEGMSVGEAFTAFCQEIVANAQILQ